MPSDALLVYNNIKVGFYHKCTNKGITFLSCTGGNSHSQLSVPLTHVESLVESFATGYLTSCAINHEGHLQCWGSGKDGLTQNNLLLIDRSTHHKLDLTNASLSLTNRHACILTHGKAYCWGWNKYGQLDAGNID